MTISLKSAFAALALLTALLATSVRLADRRAATSSELLACRSSDPSCGDIASPAFDSDGTETFEFAFVLPA